VKAYKKRGILIKYKEKGDLIKSFFGEILLFIKVPGLKRYKKYKKKVIKSI